MKKDQWVDWAFMLGLWALIVWLIHPLISLKNIDTLDVTEYMVRTILGIIIMIILFGKNAFDLFLPRAYSKKLPRINLILLAFYTGVLGGGIIFMIARLLTFYFRALGSEVSM